jgi:hypothetical protein
MFTMLPFLIFVSIKLLSISKGGSKTIISINMLKLLGIFGIVLPLMFFFWFNNASYGSPTTMLGGSSILSVKAIDADGNPKQPVLTPQQKIDQLSLSNEPSGNFSYFKSRNIINGLFIHILSPDRGILYFTPVIFLSLIGIAVMYRNKNQYLGLIMGIIVSVVLLYSMWGDPWGGWAFGSRYLIPAYALSAVLLSKTIDYSKKRPILLIAIYLLITYSVAVNTLGAITTSALPPKTEVLALEKLSGRQEKYTYERNYDFLLKNGTKSFAYNTWLKPYLSALNFFYLISGSISLLLAILSIKHYKSKFNHYE